MDIFGIPWLHDEDTDNIAITLAKAIGSTITKEDIQISHRKSNKENANIIVKFLSRRSRNDFWVHRRNLKGKTVSDIFPEIEECRSKIFINENLTARNT